jgi:hypothetical protein
MLARVVPQLPPPRTAIFGIVPPVFRDSLRENFYPPLREKASRGRNRLTKGQTYKGTGEKNQKYKGTGEKNGGHVSYKGTKDMRN